MGNPQFASLKEVLSQYGELKNPVSKGDASRDDRDEEGEEEVQDLDDEDDDDDEDRIPEDTEPFPVIPSGGEDHDGAATSKEAATEAKTAVIMKRLYRIILKR